MAINDGWYESYLGGDRLARFMSAARHDRKRAIALVDWDREMRGELQKILGEWEIALRNAYDAAISSWWTGPTHWLRDPRSPVLREIMHGSEDLNRRTRYTIHKAVSRTKPEDPIGRVIANLTLRPELADDIVSRGTIRQLWRDRPVDLR